MSPTTGPRGDDLRMFILPHYSPDVHFRKSCRLNRRPHHGRTPPRPNALGGGREGPRSHPGGQRPLPLWQHGKPLDIVQLCDIFAPRDVRTQICAWRHVRFSKRPPSVVYYTINIYDIHNIYNIYSKNRLLRGFGAVFKMSLFRKCHLS